MGETTRWRNKPVVVEAVQFTKESITDVWKFLAESEAHGPYADRANAGGITLTIPTLEGDHTAREGDWIIRGVKGEFYPCKPDIFAATYEPALLATPSEPRGQDAGKVLGWVVVVADAISPKVWSVLAFQLLTKDAAERIAQGIREDSLDTLVRVEPVGGIPQGGER